MTIAVTTACNRSVYSVTELRTGGSVCRVTGWAFGAPPATIRVNIGYVVPFVGEPYGGHVPPAAVHSKTTNEPATGGCRFPDHADRYRFPFPIWAAKDTRYSVTTVPLPLFICHFVRFVHRSRTTDYR